MSGITTTTLEIRLDYEKHGLKPFNCCGLPNALEQAQN